MRHLTPEQVVDVADGVGTASSTRHLRACTACQRQLTELRLATSMAAEVDVPEPSPLFWDHFSARVHDAVNVGHETSVRTPGGAHSRGVGAAAGWFTMHPAVAGAFAMVVAAGLLLNVGRQPPTSARPTLAAVAVDVLNDVVPVVEDPSLSLVADLAADLDWEAALEAGLITQVGVDDDALSQLTSVERGELRRLLQGELSPSRRGA